MNPIDEAAEWLTKSRERKLDADERGQLAAWLAESPLHVREYLESGEIWVALQSPDIGHAETKAALLEAMRNCADTNICVLGVSNEKPEFSQDELEVTPANKSRRRLTLFAMVASLSCIALIALPMLIGNATTYKTTRGEQRSLVLSDGSVVQLNTLSTLFVHFDKSQRRVELAQGEAFFRVAHDQVRPFNVETPFATVHSVGTEFDVYNRASSTNVAVIEGKVRVESSSARRASSDRSGEADGRDARLDMRETRNEANAFRPGSIAACRRGDGGGDSIFLSAGQELTASCASLSNPVAAKTQNAIAWMQRRIVLDNDRIETAVIEFNRYNHKQIQIDDPALADVRITAVFDANDPYALVKYLQEALGVRTIDADQRIMLRR